MVDPSAASARTPVRAPTRSGRSEFGAKPVRGRAARPAAKKKKAPSAAHIVATAEHVLTAALPRRLPRDVLARAAGVSIAELHKAFRAVRGVSLYVALIRLRLDAADRLLRTAAMTPEQTALQCGFTHFGVFQRHYRLRFGCDPVPAAAGEGGE